MQMGRGTFLKVFAGAVVAGGQATRVLAGCGNCKSHAKKAAKPWAVTLCGRCGEIKGTDKCCLAGAKRCACGAIKGSPGCCKIKIGGKDAALCANCGEVKGSKKCCAPGVKRCSCGAYKGSPGCRIGCAAKKKS